MIADGHEHDRGLVYDVSTMVDRRGLLKLVAGVSLLPLVAAACGAGSGSGGDGATAPASTAAADGTSAAAGSCEPIPEETAGPFPGDGSNGVNVLTESGIVRSDIRSSFGTSAGEAAGVPLTLELTLLDGASGCAPLAGAAVYVWHCDRSGNYSLYSEGVTDQNYLRGVQETDAGGRATFTSIFPGCYSGRWPHVHFEVYPSLDAAGGAGGVLATSQLALPKDACDAAYGADGYGQSVVNLSGLSLETDNVFADGATLQLAGVTGNVDDGYVAELTFTV